MDFLIELIIELISSAAEELFSDFLESPRVLKVVRCLVASLLFIPLTVLAAFCTFSADFSMAAKVAFGALTLFFLFGYIHIMVRICKKANEDGAV